MLFAGRAPDIADRLLDWRLGPAVSALATGLKDFWLIFTP
jgi:hypothetical protein